MTKDDIIRIAQEAGAMTGTGSIQFRLDGSLERFFNNAYAAGAKDKTLKPLTYEQIAELNLSAVTTTDAVNDVRAIELAHGIGVKND
jgi:hypothetical protein